MNENILNARICLRIDTLENWMASSSGLAKGEVALATSIDEETGESIVTLKVGEDGTKSFSQLGDSFRAKSSDLIAACKDEESLKTFITDTIGPRVEVVEGEIDKLNGDETVEGSVAQQISAALASLELQDLIDRIAEAERALNILNGEESVNGSVRHTVIEEIGKVVAGAPEDFDTLKEFADWIANDETGAAAMNSDIIDLQNILAGIGGLDEPSTVIDYVTTIEGGLENDIQALITRVDNIVTVGGEPNVIDSILLNGVILPIENKTVNIELPAATLDSLGIVRSSTKENEISVQEDGPMAVNSLNVDRLTQTEGAFMTLYGGTASI